MIFLGLGFFCLIIGILFFLTHKSKGPGGIAIFVAAILLVASFAAPVKAGHTGVVTTFGKVEDTTLDSGLNWIAPWKTVIQMDNREQKQTLQLKCFSSDIQEVTMSYTVNYRISEADAMTIYKNIGESYYDVIIVPAMLEHIKDHTAQYTASDLVNNRSALAEGIESSLYESLMEYNIVVTNTSIEDLDFTDSFTNAVEEKQVAEQNMLRAETEAAQKVIEAEAAAQVRQIEADAEAYEVTAKASAEADANLMIAESLTDDLIQYQYATAWNGELPVYMADSNTMPVLNFTGNGNAQ